MATAYITHPDCLLHDAGDHHPESPQRLHAIRDRLIATGLDDLLHHYDAPLAEPGQLARVHSEAYIRQINRLDTGQGIVHLDPDTGFGPHSLQASYRAAGAAVLATDLVASGKEHNAFCAVRPPGHHAESGRGMGFCIFNNVAVAAAHALERHGMERVAIVDFDVHHGNGTEQAFQDDPRVLFLSSFEYPSYPYTEYRSAIPHLIHTPLQPGTRGGDYATAIEQQWLPALETFRPQMLFVSAGFDSHCDDDMGRLLLKDADYSWLTAQLMAVADRHAEGRIVSLLEGGYQLDALARAVVAHIRVLMAVDG